ncbi:MAG: fatty acid desaturase [Planctomycetota bacterium]|nr:fatty acid desaturase [Planctomycetota bacterium]
MTQPTADVPDATSAAAPAAPARKKSGRQIEWYRCPIERDLLKTLSQRSDFRGFLQTFGHLGLYSLTAGLALYGFGRWPVGVVIAIVFLHGMIASFLINGMHELVHNTVFRSAWLNAFFLRVVSFLGWINFQTFNASHMRHHAYTLHPPDDLEVVLPIKLMVRQFLEQGFVNPRGFWGSFMYTLRIARGKFEGEWELALYPPGSPEKRRPAIRWARTVLFGHLLIVAVSVYFKLWLLPVLITFGPFYGSWMFWLCNNTQHVGLRDNVPDFRMNCRTFLLNPFTRLLYWQMNYHTEHHMYPTVPCYYLARLHKAVEHDLPPTPHGIVAVWREIIAIMRKQKADPTYQHQALVPQLTAKAE